MVSEAHDGSSMSARAALMTWPRRMPLSRHAPPMQQRIALADSSDLDDWALNLLTAASLSEVFGGSS
jgi:hypothetical protein